MEAPSSQLVPQERRHASATRDFSKLDPWEVRLTCIELSMEHLTSKVDTAIAKLPPAVSYGPEHAVCDKVDDSSGRVDRLELEGMQDRIDRLELLLFRASFEDFELIDKQLQVMRSKTQPRVQELHHAGFENEVPSPRSEEDHGETSCKRLLFEASEKDELLTELLSQGPNTDQCGNHDISSVEALPVVLSSPVGEQRCVGRGSSPHLRPTVAEDASEKSVATIDAEIDKKNVADEDPRLKNLDPDYQNRFLAKLELWLLSSTFCAKRYFKTMTM